MSFMESPYKKKKVRKLFFDNRRFECNGKEEEAKIQVAKWRMKERMKTVGVALVCCLNIGVDPPDVVKTSPCARMECWLEPSAEPPQKALEGIGSALQSQYERWQPRARYKQCLDPTVDDVKKLCTSLRRSSRDERVLFHYNGHGVPRPTSNGEIWVFNKNYTQYIPLSLFELQGWMESPSIYVFDCSAAGLILQWYSQFAEQRNREQAREGKTCNIMQNSILLAACGANETLPTNPQFPADVFTACLTTPIKMALRWFCSTNLNKAITPDLIDQIPGKLNDRRTILGQLNWIFTAITDTIAWNVLPQPLFQKLFRQDLLVASLFRNFLLAERIMRSAKCTPSSYPKLPSTSHHPMWRSWDLAADLCLSHLAKAKQESSLPSLSSSSTSFPQTSFFEDQLTAFDVWLQFASEKRIEQNRIPEQLPIILQVLLSQAHRLRALVLLAKFLDLGVWAVNLALSVGIFPYVVKLLQSPAVELHQVLVFIWAKILAIDKSCQLDLVKDNGHNYFLGVLASPISSTKMSISKTASRFSTDDMESAADDHTLAAFALAVICDNCRPGQIACLSCGLLPLCLSLLPDAHPLLRCWLVFCLGKLWEDFEEAKVVGVREGAHEKLCSLLTDPITEVRAAAVFSIGTLIAGAGTTEARMNIELNLGLTLPAVMRDASPLVRKELIVSLRHLTCGYPDRFQEAITELHNDAIEMQKAEQTTTNNHRHKPKRSPAPLLQSSLSRGSERGTGGERGSGERRSGEGGRGERGSGGFGGDSSANVRSSGGSVFDVLWKVILSIRNDPYQEIGLIADFVAHDLLKTVGISLSLPPITTHPHPAPPSSLASSSSLPSIDFSSSSPFRPLSSRGKRHIFGTLSSSHNDDEGSSPSPATNDEGKGSSFGSILRRFGSDLQSLQSSGILEKDSEKDNHASSSRTSNVGSLFSSSSDNMNNSMEIEPRSVLFSWACGNLSSPLLQPLEEDETAPHYLRRVWRNKRKNEALGEAIRRGNRGIAACRRFDDQLAILDNSVEHTSHLLFHPFDDVLITCNIFDQIQAWSWREGVRTACFSNNNSPNSHLTGVLLINDHDQPLLCTSASDGVVRVWDHPSISNPADASSYITGGKMGTSPHSQTPYLSTTPKLVTAFKGLPDFGPAHNPSKLNMIIDWQQESGLLMTSGDVKLVRVWNMERELQVQDIQIDSPVVALANDSPIGRSIVVGCDDGSVKMYDSRSTSSRYALSSSAQEFQGRILKVHRSKNLLIAGNVDGLVKTWDLRKMSRSLRTVSCFKGEASSVAVHDYLPLFAVGSQSQKVKVYNFEGDEISMIRYHDGFLGQRIGPISCLSFHPYRPYLAAGARDSIVSVYGGSS